MKIKTKNKIGHYENKFNNKLNKIENRSGKSLDSLEYENGLEKREENGLNLLTRKLESFNEKIPKRVKRQSTGKFFYAESSKKIKINF